MLMWSTSVLQQVGVVDARRAPGTEDRHDDGQPHDDLGGGHHHHEERDDLPVQRAVDPAEGDQGEVGGVEHQLHAHEQDDGVAPDQDTDRRRDQQGGGDFEGEDVLGEQQRGDPLDVAVGVRLVQAVGGHFLQAPVQGGPDQPGEADAEHDRGGTLPAQRLDQRVRGVPADQHQDEQEQHDDRAGVHDDLHHADERTGLQDVEDAEREHRQDQEQRGVYGVACPYHPDGAEQRDRREDPERDRLTGTDGTGDRQCRVHLVPPSAPTDVPGLVSAPM